MLEQAVKVPLLIYSTTHRFLNNDRQKNPVNITKAIKWISKNLNSRNFEKDWKEWIAKNNYVVIEYGEERAFCNQRYKIVCDINGRPKWLVDLKKDPKERKNIVNEKDITKEISISQLMIYARRQSGILNRSRQKPHRFITSGSS